MSTPRTGFPGAGRIGRRRMAATLAGGAVVRLACSWRLRAEVRDVDGSFHDFTPHRFDGTARTLLASPPAARSGRATADWAARLAAGERFEAERLADVGVVLDRIYGR